LHLWTLPHPALPGSARRFSDPTLDNKAVLTGGRPTKLFVDDSRCPVLDPGLGKTKPSYLWAIARDDRPWSGADPPAVA